MQLADCSSTNHSAGTDSASRSFSSANQKAYLCLKQALSLTLRRQIFIAVCDDLSLRNRLAAQLYAELAYPAQASPIADYSSPGTGERMERRSPVTIDGLRTDSLSVRQSLSVAYPRLVSLNLNLSDPNPMVQLAHWLTQYPPPRNPHQPSQAPGFQILGAERLTRQSATIQRQFLNSIQQIEDYLPDLESALLLWVSRPWLHAIQQSAPAFWNWRTALFEFEGDPTPVPVSTFLADTSPANHQSVARTHTNRAGVNRMEHCQETVAETGESVRQKQPTLPAPVLVSPVATSNLGTRSHAPSPAADSQRVPPESTEQNFVSFKDELWAILSHDLALLQEQQEDGTEATVAEPPQQLQPAVKATDTRQTEPPQPAPPTLSVPTSLHSPAAKSFPYPLHRVEDLAELVLSVAMAAEAEAPADGQAELLQALEQIEQLHQEQASNHVLAESYRSLGNLYRDRIEQGDDTTQNLMIAICAYEQVLQWLDEAASLWSDVLNDIGNLYWMLSRRETEESQIISYLERSIAAYQWGLSHIEPHKAPHGYAMIQNNLGSAYGDLARYRPPAEALTKSVQAYGEALRYRNFEDDPARYAATQNNLGTAYWNLAQHHQPVRCLQQAIAAYNEALRYYNPNRESLYYAMIQNNLGTAYWNLAQHKQSAPDEVEPLEVRETVRQSGKNATTPASHSPIAPSSPADWLKRAIAAYHAALKFRTVEVVPAAYAATQNNLGTAHWHLANLSGIQPSERRDHLQQAIAAYRAALTAVHYLTTAATPATPLTFDPFATHNNLGLACYQMALDKQTQDDGKKRLTYLDAALQHHLQALQGWQHNPDFYQTAFSYVIQTIRGFYSELGMNGQNQALSKIPPALLPEVMKRL